MWSLLAAVFGAGAVFAAGLWTAHHWDEGTIADLKVAQQRQEITDLAQAMNRIRKADAATLRNQKAYDAAHERIVVETRLITQKVPVYVTRQTDARYPIPYSVVRVLDAAATGRDPSDLPLPAGQSDGSPSPVAASALAGNVAENYGSCRLAYAAVAAWQAWATSQYEATTGNPYAVAAPGAHDLY